MANQEPEVAHAYTMSEDKKLSIEQTADVLAVEATSTAEEERAVVRKIDMVILPLMCFVFFLQYLDKQSLSYAAVRNETRCSSLGHHADRNRSSAFSPISI